MKKPKLQDNNVVLKDGGDEIIVSLAKKYKLGPVKLFDNPEMEKKLRAIKTPKERMKILENLPFRKINKLIKKVAQGTTKLKDLTSAIQQELKIPEEKAKRITEDLKNKVFIKGKSDKTNSSPKKLFPGSVSRKNDLYRETVD